MNNRHQFILIYPWRNYSTLKLKCPHQFLTICLFIENSWRGMVTITGVYKRQSWIWLKDSWGNLLRLLLKIATWRVWNALEGALSTKWNWNDWWKGEWKRQSRMINIDVLLVSTALFFVHMVWVLCWSLNFC